LALFHLLSFNCFLEPFTILVNINWWEEYRYWLLL
jgi:hypothetical protein